jgi:site-specific recombinase XerD
VEATMIRGVFEKVPGSGVWWIHFYDAEGKRRREKVGRKSDARKLYLQRKADAAVGRKIDRPLRQRERTFEKCANLALEYSRNHKSNVTDDKQKIAILVREFGLRRASTITQQEFTTFLASRGNGPATFNRYRATLSLIYREAIRAGWLEDNPARLMKSKKEPAGRIRYLADVEEEGLRSVIEENYPHFAAEFDLALHTGMRLSELFSLEWLQVDEDRRQIRLLKTKNGSSRVCPLNSVALAAIRKQQQVTGGHKFVFLNSEGKPFRRSPIRRWFDDACRKARIKDFTWHCLRHTFASRLVMADVDLRTVQELMGHKTIQMTARYAHLSPAHLQSAVERLTATEQPLPAHQ